MYGVGILGLGYWYGGYRLTRALQEHKDAKLLGIYGEHKANAERLGSTFGIPVVNSPEELLALDGLDIVFIAAPALKIPEYGVLAAKAGKHMVIGKPVGKNLADVDRLIQAVEKSGVKYVTLEAYDSVLHPLKNFGILKKIEEGELGEIVRIQTTTHSSIAEGFYYSGEPGWFADPQLSAGGALIDYGIYNLELMRYLAKSEVSKIHFARTGKLIFKELEVEDWGMSAFTFENGIEASMEMSWTIVTPQRIGPSPQVNTYVRSEIIGDKGRMIIEGPPYYNISVLSDNHPFWDTIRIVENVTECEPPPFDALKALIGTIEGKEEPLRDLHDARECLRVFLEMYALAEKNN